MTTYKEAFDAMLQDFNSFFWPGFEPKIQLIVQGLEPAKAVGTGKICISDFHAGVDLESAEQFFVALIIMGHELAHCVNHHNKHRVTSKFDSKVLEQWADYFGARVSFTLLTFGERTRTRALSYPEVVIPYKGIDSIDDKIRVARLLRLFGDALEVGFHALYLPTDASDNYPRSADRIFTAIAGVQSFFFRGTGTLSQAEYTQLFDSLIKGRPWLARAAYMGSSDAEIDMTARKTAELHVELAESKNFITPGLKPEFRRLIGTAYTDSESARLRNKKLLQANFADWDDGITKHLQLDAE